MKRRTFLTVSVSGGALAIIAAAGLLRPTRVLATAWPQAAFLATSADAVAARLFDDRSAVADDAIELRAPNVASGDAVPIKVTVNVPQVESIAIVVAENRHPLSSVIRLSGPVRGYSSRIRMQGSSRVTALVKAGGRLYSASAAVKISMSGYGMAAQ